MKISLDAVEAIEAIAQHGSFSAAARHLHKAQSAVSYLVRQLEDRLGVDVFDRSGHRAVFTPAGVALLDEGRFLLSRARRIESLAEQFRQDWEPRLQVVVDGALPTRPVMVALKTLGDEAVPTHVQVRTEFLAGVPRRFEADGADLMLTLSWDPSDLLLAHPLPDEELVLVAAATHAVHAHQGPHDLLSLQQHLEVSVHDSSDATRGRDTNTIGGARVFYVSDFRTKKEALCMGLGFGWLPLRDVSVELTRGLLRELDYAEGSRWLLQPHLVTRRDRPLGRAGRRLLEVLTQAWPAASRGPSVR